MVARIKLGLLVLVSLYVFSHTEVLGREGGLLVYNISGL